MTCRYCRQPIYRHAQLGTWHHWDTADLFCDKYDPEMVQAAPEWEDAMTFFIIVAFVGGGLLGLIALMMTWLRT